jgi:hypothetical protein
MEPDTEPDSSSLLYHKEHTNVKLNKGDTIYME